MLGALQHQAEALGTDAPDRSDLNHEARFDLMFGGRSPDDLPLQARTQVIDLLEAANPEVVDAS